MPHPIQNPPNPWLEAHIDWEGEPPPAELTVFEERARSALSTNDSPDVGFRHSVNPYRGCYHGCAYCYARPSHQYLGFGAGTDFERKIIVKTNIVDCLRDDFMRKSWQGELIVFSGNTDCYQPLEASYRLTRGCLELCHAFRNPIAIITKSAVIRRDADILAALARDAYAHVTISAAFATDEDGRKIEPWASPISRRFETMRMLHEAGVPVGISLAPIIPGLNDAHIPELLERAKEHGASTAFMTLVRLSAEVKQVFIERVRAAFPDREQKIENAIREMRGGGLNNANFHDRMVGLGPRWKTIEQLFDLNTKRLGMNEVRIGPTGPTTFARPESQLSLF